MLAGMVDDVLESWCTQGLTDSVITAGASLAW
jgi:hypothetical protein